jgi:hypothetical protein
VEAKVWICHGVEGQGEFKTGWNLIEVDASAVDGQGQNDHSQHVTKDGRSDIIPALGVEDGAAPYCPAPVPLTPVTPAINAPTCTAAGTVIEHTGVIWAVDGTTATATAADGYRIVGQSTFDLGMLDGDDGCPGPPPQVVVRSGEEGSCDTGTVLVYRYTTTTPYRWNAETQDWELDTARATQEYTDEVRDMTAGELADCGAPDPDVVRTGWVDDQDDCATGEVVQFRTVVTTPYRWDSETRTWVLDTENATREFESRRRDMTADELAECRTTVAPPTLPTVVAPTCDADGYVVLPESTPGYDWELQADGTYEAVPDDGAQFAPGTVTTFDPGDLDQLVGDQCQASNPPPGTTVPVTAPTAPTAVASSGAELPATGGSPGTVALLGLLALGLGTAVVRISRRPIIR